MFRPALSLLIGLASLPLAAQTSPSADFVALNQTQAQAGDSALGDSPGFPITLAKSGHYKLTSNLVVPAGVDGIVVNPGLNVIIDLNGFQIVGPAVCSISSSCQASPGTAGIRVASEASHLSVRNGRIRGFSDSGLSGRSGTGGDNELAVGDMNVEDVQLWNNRNGVTANRLIGQRIHAKGNSWNGIYAEYGMVQTSFAISNYTGIYLRRGRISDSAALQNHAGGIVGGSTVLLHNNTATGNSGNYPLGANTAANLGF